MEDVKAQQRYGPPDTVRSQYLDDYLPKGDCLNEFHAGMRGPNGKLVHRQKISGIGFEKRQTEQKKTYDPVQFPGFSKGAGENHSQDMQKNKYQKCMGCEPVKAADV